jgi:hypothetical protein
MIVAAANDMSDRRAVCAQRMRFLPVEQGFNIRRPPLAY